MGRKRLLTILATITAAVTLQVGPAAAQTVSLPGVGDVSLGADECLEIGVDISLADALKLDPSICISENGVEVEGGAAGLDVGSVTEPVEEVTKKAAETTKKATGGAAEPAAPSDPATSAPKPPSTDGGGGEGGGGGSSTGGGNSSGGSTSAGGSATAPQVAASGRAAEVRERDAARDRHLGALRAIRSDLAAGSPGDRGIAGPVQTFGGLATTDDLAAPQVADAGGGIVPGVEAGLDPLVAPATDQQDAILANSLPTRDLADAPVALQLLAAALVLGAAAVWTIAAREMGKGTTTTSA